MASKHKKFLNKEEHYELIKELVKTHNLTQIGKILGCGPTCVCEFVNEHGLKTQYGSVRRLLEQNKDKITEMSKTMYVSEIAKEFNLNTNAVANFCRKNGIESKDEISRKNIEPLVLEYHDKMYLDTFCKEFNVSKSQASLVAKRLGVEFIKYFKLGSIHNKVVEVLKENTVADAAVILGVSKGSLRSYIREKKLDYKSPELKTRLPGHIVYAYYDNEGIVRYYGEGSTDERAYQFKSHADSKGYSNYFSKDNPPTVKILHYGLSKDEALRIEKELVDNNLSTINTIYNHPSTSRRKRDVDIKLVNDMLYYDETSPTCLRWKEGFENYGNKKAHSIAGSQPTTGNYSSVDLGNKTVYRTHVIVWALHRGSVNKNMVIDHIDGNKLNNRIDNLREVSVSENGKNKTTKSSCGYKNISWIPKYNAYVVYWSIEGRRFTKTFTVGVYGSKELTLEAALAKRQEMIEQGWIIVREDNVPNP